MLTDSMVLYMYTAHGQGKITLAEYNFDCNFKLLLLQLILHTSAMFIFVGVFIALKSHFL